MVIHQLANLLKWLFSNSTELPKTSHRDSDYSEMFTIPPLEMKQIYLSNIGKDQPSIWNFAVLSYPRTGNLDLIYLKTLLLGYER